MGADSDRERLALDTKTHSRSRHYEPHVEAAAAGDRKRHVLELARLVEVCAVDREHAERRSRDREGLAEAVGVDQSQADRCTGRDSLAPAGVVTIQGRDAVVRVDGDREVESGGRSRGSMTRTPKRPRRTSFEETWWVWYQNVPTCSARNR